MTGDPFNRWLDEEAQMLASPDDIVTSLKDYRLKVVEDGGWRARGTGYRFEPYGQAWHHDAITEAVSDARALEIMRSGRPDLRGPLCNGWIDSSSVVYLVAYGNANHAGWNEADVHARLKAGKAPLGDARLDADDDSIVGNPFLWGWECRNAGTGADVWEQLDAMEHAGAALCDACGWSPNAQAAHRELTARKPDPAGIHMPTFRADVARICSTKGDTMTEEQERLLRRVHDALGLAGLDDQKAKGNIKGRVDAMFTILKADTDDVDEAKIAGLVLAGLDASVIAAAIPEDIAAQVVNELRDRLAG